MPLQDLTMREEDVLRGLCRGMTNQEIADALVVSIDTVKSHVGSLLRKLPARDRTMAVVTAFREGLVQVPTRPPRWTSGPFQAARETRGDGPPARARSTGPQGASGHG